MKDGNISIFEKMKVEFDRIAFDDGGLEGSKRVFGDIFGDIMKTAVRDRFL